MVWSPIVNFEGLLPNTRKARRHCVDLTGIRYYLQISGLGTTFFTLICPSRKREGGVVGVGAEGGKVNGGSKPYIEVN
jgi:hypothetical protein